MQCLAHYRELQKREEGAGKWSKAEQQRLLVSSPPSQANPCLPCLCVHLLPLHCLKPFWCGLSLSGTPWPAIAVQATRPAVRTTTHSALVVRVHRPFQTSRPAHRRLLPPQTCQSSSGQLPAPLQTALEQAWSV